MLGVRLPRNLETRLARLAKRTGRTKSYYVRQALEQFLERDVEEARRQSILASGGREEDWQSDDTGWTS